MPAAPSPFQHNQSFPGLGHGGAAVRAQTPISPAVAAAHAKEDFGSESLASAKKEDSSCVVM